MTSKAETLLTSLRDYLGAVSGVQSSKIGLEVNIEPSDYPIVRIVPSIMQRDSVWQRRYIEALIYFGQAVDQSDSGGLQAAYSAWLTMEEALITACSTWTGGICIYDQTITDEGRTAGYLMLALKVQIRG